VAELDNHRVQYFTASGSFLGKWGTKGSGNGELFRPDGVSVAPNGHIYVTDIVKHHVQYFTAKGSFLGKFGTSGSGNGEFDWPYGVAFPTSGARIYVADGLNYRIQYFKRRD
jgi:DNA-binding beta-propeller fold protein YncE